MERKCNRRRKRKRKGRSEGLSEGRKEERERDKKNQTKEYSYISSPSTIMTITTTISITTPQFISGCKYCTCAMSVRSVPDSLNYLSEEGRWQGCPLLST